MDSEFNFCNIVASSTPQQPEVSQGYHKKQCLTKKRNTAPRKPKHSDQKPKLLLPKRRTPPAHNQGGASPFSKVEQCEVEAPHQQLPVEFQAWAEQQNQYFQQQLVQQQEHQQQLAGPGPNALHPLFGGFGYPNTFQNN